MFNNNNKTEMDQEGLHGNINVVKCKTEPKRYQPTTELKISKVENIDPIIFCHDDHDFKNQDFKNLKDMKLKRILSNNRKSRVFNNDKKNLGDKDFQVIIQI